MLLAGNKRRARRGVTLIELMIVMTLISLMAGLSWPALSSGIEALRLSAACEDVSALMTKSQSWAERRQTPVEVTFSIPDRAMSAYSVNPGLAEVKQFEPGIAIAEVLPPLPIGDPGTRRFLMMPGGTPPRIGIVLVNRRGDRRLVRMDPISGVASIERLEPGVLP